MGPSDPRRRPKPAHPQETQPIGSPPAGDPEMQRTVALPGGMPSPMAMPGTMAMPGPGTLLGERFEVASLLGQGPYSTLYRVRDRRVEGREVALEVFHAGACRLPRFRELFPQEVRAAQNFVSPFIAPVLETGNLEDGAPFLTRDLINGDSLARVLAHGGSLTERHGLEIARQTLLGLQRAHDQGFVHGEVSPDSILLDTETAHTEANPFAVSVRLVGFGIGSLVRDVVDDAKSVFPPHAAPEVARGEVADERADLFSVGACLFECVTGEALVSGQGKALVQVIGHGDFRARLRAAELSRPMRALLGRALTSDPDRRFRSAAAFVSAIESCAAYREPTAASTWTRVAFALVTAIALAEGALIFLPREVAAAWLPGDVAAALERARASGPRQPASSSAQLDTYAAEVKRLKAELLASERSLGEVRDELAQRSEEAQAANERLAALSARAPQRAQDEPNQSTPVPVPAPPTNPNRSADSVLRLHEDHAALRAEYKSLLDRHVATQARLAALEAENQSLRDASEPTARTARAFDEVLRHLREGQAATAQERWDDFLRAAGSGAAERADLRLITALVQGAVALSRSNEPAALDLARQRLQQVRADLDGFAQEGKTWWDHPALGGTLPDRAGSVLAALTRLERKLEQASSSADKGLADLVSNARADLDSFTPVVALLLGERFGDPGFAASRELTGLLAERLEAELVREGRLDLQRLNGSQIVRLWGERLLAPDPPFSGAETERLRWLALAQRWYGNETVPAQAVPIPMEGSSGSSTVGSIDKWRARLALQINLAQDGSAFPLGQGETAIYEHETPTTRVFLLDEGGADGRIERRVFDTDGRPIGTPQTFAMTRAGERWSAAGSEMVDLRDGGDHVRVALWSEATAALPPAEWSRAIDQNEWRARLAAEPIPILVVETPTTTLWLSPEFGLVRESRGTHFTRRLAYTSSPASQR